MSLPPTSPSVTGTPSGHAVPDRNVLRSELIRARKALAPADWERHSAAVQRRVLALPEWRDARTVAMYIAVRNEISTDEIIRRAWAEGKQVLLPRCLPPSEGEGIMEFVLCRGYDELTPGAFGLSEPGPACVPLPRTGWEQDAAGTFVPPSGTDASLRLPDLILVPAVGISPAGTRLGYGKGFYDRLLALPGTRYYTGHCTGLPSYARLAEKMGRRVAYLHAGDTVEI